MTVAYSTANGTATAGADYMAASGTVTFAAGETSKMVHVDIAGDVLAEGNETFTVNLSAPTGATIADGTAIGTILDDDGTPLLPALSIADLAVVEGNGEHAHFMFTVTLDKAATGAVTVAYMTANGTATAGSDYAATSGSLTFAAGETSKTVHVDIGGDTAFEANETFTVALSNASGATIADATAVGTIVNDDPAPDQAMSATARPTRSRSPGPGAPTRRSTSTPRSTRSTSAGWPGTISPSPKPTARPSSPSRETTRATR